MNWMLKSASRRATWACCCLSLLLLAACASPSEDRPTLHAGLGTTIAAVGHLGGMVGIPNFYINGKWAGHNDGWGGGGSDICCINLPSNLNNTTITVKWETCDISHIEFRNDKRVDPNAKCISAWHEAIVPVHSAEKNIGNHNGLVIHFLSGNKIEAWTSDQNVRSTDYPGPKYPSGPAPDYSKY